MNLPLSSFNRRGAGRQPKCRECNKTYQWAYRERVTKKSPYQTALRITAHRLSILRSTAEVPADLNTLALLTGVRGISKSNPFVAQVRSVINGRWDSSYNSSDQDIDHVIAFRFYNITNAVGTVDVEQLFKFASYRNLQILTKDEHAAKTASELRQRQPILTAAQMTELVDLLP